MNRRLSTLFSTTLIIAGSLFAAVSASALDDPDIQRLQEATAAFDNEPDVYAVQRRVIETRDWQHDEIDRWTRRARLSNLLPRLRASASWLDQRDRQDRFREDIETDEEGLYHRDGAQHLWREQSRARGLYSLSMTFSLADLVFTRDEMTIQREVRSRWSARDDLLDEVTDLYFERRRLQLLQKLVPESDAEARLDRMLRIEALTARIDALTGGWFRHQVE